MSCRCVIVKRARKRKADGGGRTTILFNERRQRVMRIDKWRPTTVNYYLRIGYIIWESGITIKRFRHATKFICILERYGLRLSTTSLLMDTMCSSVCTGHSARIKTSKKYSATRNGIEINPKYQHIRHTQENMYLNILGSISMQIIFLVLKQTE